MIQPNELRLNNLFSHQGKIKKVFSISQTGVFGTSIENGNEVSSCLFEEMNPIPLTDEWLIRFRFEYSGGMGYKSPHNTSYWHFSLGNGFVPSIYAKHTASSDGYVGCKYVHQLQNLCHALTWQELEIKNPRQITSEGVI